jgi:acyl carrier protein
VATSQIADRVREVAAFALDEATANVNAETSLESLDSIDHAELVMALEEEFGIEIPEEVLDKPWGKVGDALAYIEGRLR